MMCLQNIVLKQNLPSNKIKNAYLGPGFSQSIHQGGSTCIFIDLPCIILDVSQFCVEKIINFVLSKLMFLMLIYQNTYLQITCRKY